MLVDSLENEPAAAISGLIKDYVASSPDNSLQNQAGETAWREPLVGFASGADGLFTEFRRHIGQFVWLPQDALQKAYPQMAAPAEDLTVICWILPQALYTIEENAAQDIYPSERWARARHFGEEFNVGLRRHVADKLQAAGVPAMSPMLHPEFKRMDSKDYSFASVWSERHAAYVAGLGTFGLCDGLITAKGKAVRVGSVVARLSVPPSPRPYDHPHAYCLHFTHGTCGKCIERCPVGALGPAGHDKLKCQHHVEVVSPKYVEKTYKINNYACGLCQAGVPCSDHIPTPEEG